MVGLAMTPDTISRNSILDFLILCVIKAWELIKSDQPFSVQTMMSDLCHVSCCITKRPAPYVVHDAVLGSVSVSR